MFKFFLGPLFLFCVFVGIVAAMYYVRGENKKAERTPFNKVSS